VWCGPIYIPPPPATPALPPSTPCIDTPPCKIHTGNIWRISQGGTCSPPRFESHAPWPSPPWPLAMRPGARPKKCQFRTEKCQFRTEKCQFTSSRRWIPRARALPCVDDSGVGVAKCSSPEANSSSEEPAVPAGRLEPGESGQLVSSVMRLANASSRSTHSGEGVLRWPSSRGESSARDERNAAVLSAAHDLQGLHKTGGRRYSPLAQKGPSALPELQSAGQLRFAESPQAPTPSSNPTPRFPAGSPRVAAMPREMPV
jgi:hypothetical protein